MNAEKLRACCFCPTERITSWFLLILWLYEAPPFSAGSRGRPGGFCHLIKFYSQCSFRPICPFSLHLPAAAISTCWRVTEEGFVINPSWCWRAGKVPFGNNGSVWPSQRMPLEKGVWIFAFFQSLVFVYASHCTYYGCTHNLSFNGLN